MSIIELDGSDVILLRGSPEEMGWRHGALLRENIEVAVTEFLRRSEEIFEVPYLYILRESKRCEHFIPKQYLDEMRAIAEASGIGYEEILALNCVADIDAYFMQSIHECCNFVITPTASLNGEVMHARNLDFPLAANIQRPVSVCIARVPENGRPSFSFTTAGMVGTYTGMNESKLTVAEVNSPHHGGSPDGVPVSILLRMILERCDSLGSGYELMRKAERTCGFNLALSDGKSGDGLCIEFTRQLCAARSPRKGVLVVDNPCMCPETARNRLTYAAGAFRYARIMELLREKKSHLDSSTVLSILQDGYDVTTGSSTGKSYNCVCNYHTMQSVLMLPQSLVAHVSMSETPAPLGRYSEIDLAAVWNHIREGE